MTHALVLFMLTNALADSDLCLWGKDHDVRDWIIDGHKYSAVSCTPDESAAARLAQSLERAGYHLIGAPTSNEIPLGARPTPELKAAIKSAKCPKNIKQVFTVCVTLEEDQPLVGNKKAKPRTRPGAEPVKISLMPAIPPPLREEFKRRTPQEMRREGKTRAQ